MSTLGVYSNDTARRTGQQMYATPPVSSSQCARRPSQRPSLALYVPPVRRHRPFSPALSSCSDTRPPLSSAASSSHNLTPPTQRSNRRRRRSRRPESGVPPSAQRSPGRSHTRAVCNGDFLRNGVRSPSRTKPSADIISHTVAEAEDSVITARSSGVCFSDIPQSCSVAAVSAATPDVSCSTVIDAGAVDEPPESPESPTVLMERFRLADLALEHQYQQQYQQQYQHDQDEPQPKLDHQSGWITPLDEQQLQQDPQRQDQTMYMSRSNEHAVIASVVTLSSSCSSVITTTDASANVPNSEHITNTAAEHVSVTTSRDIAPQQSSSTTAHQVAPVSNADDVHEVKSGWNTLVESFNWADEVEEWEQRLQQSQLGKCSQSHEIVTTAGASPVPAYDQWRNSNTSPPLYNHSDGDDDSDIWADNSSSKPAAARHVLEASGFPASYTTEDLCAIFGWLFNETATTAGGVGGSGAGAVGVLYHRHVRWVDDTHALLVFPSASHAERALQLRSTTVRCRRLCDASALSRQKVAQCGASLDEVARPYKQRPETCTAQARRMVAAALGVRATTSAQQRLSEQNQLRRARDKKRETNQRRQAAWEGKI